MSMSMIKRARKSILANDSEADVFFSGNESVRRFAEIRQGAIAA